MGIRLHGLFNDSGDAPLLLHLHRRTHVGFFLGHARLLVDDNRHNVRRDLAHLSQPNDLVLGQRRQL